MKKTLIALAALAATTAFAQSTVTLSGGVSAGLQKTGTSKAAQTDQVAGVDAVNSNSFILTAVEDLGGGMKATGVIQQRLSALNADATSGDLYVDVSGGFGAVRAGKFTFNSNSGFNAFASRTVSSLAGAGQAFGANNVVTYTTPNMSGFTATVAMNAAQSATGSNGTGFKINYSKGPLAVQYAQSKAPNFVATGTEAEVTTLGVNYDLGVAKIFFNTYDQKAGVTGSSSTGVAAAANGTAVAAEKGNSLSVAVPMGALTLKAGMIDRKNNTAATSTDRTVFGLDYALSKRTTLIAEFANDKVAVGGANKRTNYFIGAAHTF
jgi:predicted porin